MVTTRALTQGRSVTNPETIRPRVLQIPTIEMRKDASTLEIPFDSANAGINM